MNDILSSLQVEPLFDDDGMIAPKWFEFFSRARPVSDIFTPTLAFATPGNSSWAYAIQAGVYTKIGRLVAVHINFNATPTIGTGSGNLVIGGLPFTASSALDYTLAVDRLGAAFTWAASRTQITARVFAGSTAAFLSMLGSGQSATTLGATNMTTATAHAINLSGVYETDE